MNLHNLLSSLVVFFALAAFGALVFALAHFASRGAFSPTVTDDEAPAETAQGGATDEATVPVQHPARGQDAPASFDS